MGQTLGQDSEEKANMQRYLFALKSRLFALIHQYFAVGAPAYAGSGSRDHTNALSAAAKPTLVDHHAKGIECQSSLGKSDLSCGTHCVAKLLLCNRA